MAPVLTARAWLEELLTLMGSVHVGTKWQCPGHALTGEHSLSLSISDRSARAVIYCHSGCTGVQILRPLSLKFAHLVEAMDYPPDRWYAVVMNGEKFPPPRYLTHGSLADRGFRFEAEHAYGYPSAVAWKERYRHPSGAKEIRWESLNNHGQRCPGLFGRRQSDLPLYLMGDVLKALGAGERIILVESESSADALTGAGLYATSWAGAAGDPPGSLIREVLGQADVLIVPDNDPAGLECGVKLRTFLPHAKCLIGNPGQDARDILRLRGSAAFL